jgi:glutaredoxin
MIVKALRNGVGGIIAGVSFVFAPKQIKRSESEQQQVDEQTKKLELYQFFACPFCIKTRRAIRRLNLDITTREVSSGPYREELLAQGGKVQAPCLKITHDNTVEWLYESGDIIDYLDEKFGKK